MGIRGLTPLIKQTKGTPAANLKEQEVHVDVQSLYYNLVRIRSFDILSKLVAKEARAKETRAKDPRASPSVPP